MKLTKYQKEKFKQLDTLEKLVWLRINPERPDKEEFVEMVKLRIDLHNDFEFSDGYTHIRRINTMHDFTPEGQKEYWSKKIAEKGWQDELAAVRVFPPADLNLKSKKK